MNSYGTNYPVLCISITRIQPQGTPFGLELTPLRPRVTLTARSSRFLQALSAEEEPVHSRTCESRFDGPDCPAHRSY